MRLSSGLAVVSIALALFAGGRLVADTYFAWAARADLYYDTDSDLAAAADWLRPYLDGETIAYIAARDRDHPTVVIEDLSDVTWLGTDTLFRPPSGKIGMVIFPRSAPPPKDWLEWLEPYASDGIPDGPDGRPAFEAFRLEADTPLPVSESLSEPAHNNSLALIDVRAKPIFSGAEGEIVGQWQVEQTPAFSDLTPLLQVEDSIGTVLARAESPLRGTDNWRPGEVVMHRMAVEIPVGTPPGNYPARMTWVGRASDQYLPYLDDSGAQTGIWMTVGQVEVLRPASFPDAAALSIANRHDVEVVPGVRLLGWSNLPTGIRPGESIPLMLYWQAVGDIRADFLVQPLIIDENRQTPLVSSPSNYPPSQWMADELVTQPVRWLVPRQQANGHYLLTLRVGDAEVELGELEIAGIPRTFDPPSVETRTETMLGESVQFYGYSMNADGELHLQLVWHASTIVDTDYTVFIHVLDSAGNIVAQRDVMPVDDTYPTSLWESGEYVIDAHSFIDIPPGNYHVRVGLYDQATGQRLSALDGNDFIDLGGVAVR